MTVNITTSRIQYDGDGIDTVFTYPFKIYEDDDLEVIIADVNGAETTLTLNTDYTVSGAGGDNGGSITLTLAALAPANTILTMLRNIDLTQDTDFSDGQTSTADGFEAPSDKSRIIDQQFNENMDRSIKVIKSSNLRDLEVIPAANKAIFFNSAATGIETRDPGSTTLAIPADRSVTGDKINNSEVFAFPTMLNLKKGADVASASALALGIDGNSFDITGTATITSIATKGVGTVVRLHFDGALILTHDAVDLFLPNGGLNITTAAGDEAIFVEYVTGKWICANYQRANGLPLAFLDEDTMSSNSATKVPSQQSVKAYADLQRKNLVINGNGIIAQRGDYTLVKDTYDFGKCDRFEGMATGTTVDAGVLTQTKTASIGITGFAHKFSGVTIAGTGIIYHRTRLEADDAKALKAQAASHALKVYHDVGGNVTYTIFIRKANVENDFSAVTEISNDGGTVVNSATPAELKFENIAMGDCSNGIEIELKIECGAITAKNFEITEVQLEKSAGSTDFENRSKPLEIALCEAYFEKSYDLEVDPGTVTISGTITARANSTSIGIYEMLGEFRVKKRATPVVIWYSESTGDSGKIKNVDGATDVTVVSTSRTGESSTGLPVLSAGVAIGDALTGHYTADSELS